MRASKLAIALITFLILFSVGIFAQAKKKEPGKLTFPAKMGAVTFDHASHVKHAKNDCKACHDKLWPEDAKAPVNFKGGAMHRTAETAKTSCAACHHPGGTAFAAKGSCNKCHMKPGAKGG
jgi:c(7)-type cytochrome triheme protein